MLNFWKTYSIIFLLSATGNLLVFFNSQSTINTYYRIMIQMNPNYLMPFEANLLNIILTFLSAIFVVLYAFNIRWGLTLALTTFILRLLTDIVGHHYELKHIQSMFHNGTTFGIIMLITFLIPAIPSYIGHFNYVTIKK